MLSRDFLDSVAVMYEGHLRLSGTTPRPIGEADIAAERALVGRVAPSMPRQPLRALTIAPCWDTQWS